MNRSIKHRQPGITTEATAKKTLLSAIGLTSIIGITCLLSACSQQHPLTTVSHKEAATLLIAAATTAEKPMGINSGEGIIDYLRCTLDSVGNVLSKGQCHTLYEHMLTYAHQQPKFSSLDLKELTNQTVVRQLAKTIKTVNVNESLGLLIKIDKQFQERQQKKQEQAS